MLKEYPNIFKTIKIKNLTMNNRIVMPAMATNLAGTYGEVTDDLIKYYQTRAKGGVGLIIIENTNIDFPFGANGAVQLRIDHDRYVPGLSKLANSIKMYGTKTCIQINHAGASTSTARIERDYVVGPSNIPVKKDGEIPKPLIKDEIYDIINKYGLASKRAKEAGFDMIEIHGGHSYLLSQFLSPLTNKRTDEFGGTIENMARFCVLVLKEVRKYVGDNYPISFRISADEYLDEGRDLAGTIEILKYIVPYIDVLNVTAGTSYSFDKQLEPTHYKEGWRVYLSEEIKKYYNIPTITVGNIRNPDFVENIIASNRADMVAIGRGLICDPNWVSKVYNGGINLIRRCISCNIGCVTNRVFANLPIKCTFNPEVLGEDRKINSQKNLKDTNAVVIGAGPAGLEAACYAAECGYNVYLFEKENEVGGFLRLIRKLPGKSKMDYIVQYMKERISKLNNLQLYLGKNPSIQEISELNPSFIINATGSTPNLPPIKGLKDSMEKGGKNIYTITTFLENIDKFKNVVNKKVIIAGGGAVGLDCAEYFAEGGAEVTIIEMLPSIANDLEIVTKTYMMQILNNHHVKIFTETYIKEIKDNEIICYNNDEELTFKLDRLIVCLGLKSYNQNIYDIKEFFKNKNIPVYNIGDSNKPRKIINSISEGRQTVKLQASENYDSRNSLFHENVL